MEPFERISRYSACPPRDTLIDFSAGRLSLDGCDFVAAHISSCARCEEVLAELHNTPIHDCLVERIRNLLSCTQPLDEVDYRWIEALAGTTMTLPPLEQRRASEGEHDEFNTGEATPKAFGPYELIGKIGQGGMGIVYRARQVSLDRIVAVKMILAGRHATSQTIARFTREGKAIARLRHPAVVQVHELGEYEGLPFYSMELVEGGSLQEILEKGPLDPKRAAQLVRTLAETAEYAHREGIVHRDLKPGNILFSRDGSPKITDFGLAKLLKGDQDELATSLTETGLILGTASYMAPEQLSGRSADITRATDIYGLGAILYESLTGCPPLRAATKLKTLELVRSTMPVPPARVHAGVPFFLEAICMKCLEKSPARRYATAQALADDLNLWLCNERPRGVPSASSRLARRVRQHAVAISIGLAALSMALALYLKRPERMLERAQGELIHGRAVTLVGRTGNPSWSRCLTGASRSSSTLADDKTFTIHSWTLNLLELLPDPKCDRYRFTAQIRHENSDVAAGEVGLYFARVERSTNNRAVHSFLQLSFNAVIGDAEFRQRLPADFAQRRPVRKNPVALLPHLYSDESILPNVNFKLGGVSGPRFQPLGENNGRWHQVEVILTPERVTASFNGESISVATDSLRRNALAELAMFPLNDTSPSRPEIRQVFDNRGGLGLYVWRGTASFRSVTVTPL